MDARETTTPDRLTPTPIARRAGSAAGFMLDSARAQENRDYYRRFVDFTAARGADTLLWHLADDQGCSLAFDGVPEIASPNAYSKAEMRELVRYAADRGVTIVPELATLGHCRFLTRLPAFAHLEETAADAHFTGMCPLHDETRRVMGGLLAEVADVFGGDDLHVGLDEVNIGGHPLTRAALATRSVGEILGDYAAFLQDVVTRQLGKRMWLWGDGLLKHPAMLARLPRRGTIVCDWQYAPDAGPETTRTLLDAGFDVMLCSALISHDQTLFPGERFALPNVRALEASRKVSAGNGCRVVGHLATVWTPVRYVADALWLGVDLAAAILRDGPAVEPLAAARAFAASFYGLDAAPAARFAEEAAAQLIEDAPLRSEWLAVAKLLPLPAAAMARVVRHAPRWTRAAQALRDLAPAVRENRVAFDAFTLLVEMLAHAYDAAALAADPAVATTTLARLMTRGESIAARLSDAWDRERFANDPRKHVAPIPSFQDDHLVPLLATGVAALRARAADAGRGRGDAPARRGRTIATPAAALGAAATART